MRFSRGSNASPEQNFVECSGECLTTRSIDIRRFCRSSPGIGVALVLPSGGEWRSAHSSGLAWLWRPRSSPRGAPLCRDRILPAAFRCCRSLRPQYCRLAPRKAFRSSDCSRGSPTVSKSDNPNRAWRQNSAVARVDVTTFDARVIYGVNEVGFPPADCSGITA